MKSEVKNSKRVFYQNIHTTAIDYAIIACGAFVYGVSVVMFTAPNNIAPGGMTGIATILNHLFGLPIGTMIFIMNIPLFIWGAVENGMHFLTKTITGTAFVSIFIDLLSLFLPVYTGDALLASIFGGLLNGAGLGFIFYRGGSTGGTDIVALNLHKHYPHISTGNIILLTDLIVLVLAYIVYGSLESVLYALTAIFVSIKMIDTVSYGTSRGNGKLIFIVTSNYRAISQLILNTIGRGVTLLEGEGAYSGDKKKIVMCAVRPQQVHRITSQIGKIDSKAFIIVTTAGTINGEGFLKLIN